jgi:sporulation protein YabP
MEDNMDKTKELLDTLNHKIDINERKNIFLTGVKKLNSFDDKEFFVDSVMGAILIKGNNLELIKLDTFQGSLSIKGKINSIIYLDDMKKKKDETLISRLFK